MLIYIFLTTSTFIYYNWWKYCQEKNNISDEFNPMQTNLYFLNLDIEGDNPYYSKINKIYCKKMHIYNDDYYYENLDENSDENSDENLDKNLDENSDENSDEYYLDENNLDCDDLDEDIVDYDDLDENSLNNLNYHKEVVNTQYDTIESFISYIKDSDMNNFHLIGYNEDIDHLFNHINGYYQGKPDININYIDVTDLSQKMFKKMCKISSVEKGWFEADIDVITDLNTLNTKYGCKENKLENVYKIFNNLITKLSKDLNLNKNNILFNIDNLYDYLYKGNNLTCKFLL